MKTKSYLIFAGLIIIGLNSCEKKSSSLVTTTQNISLGAGYTNDIYYRLSDGLITSVPRTNWDIAFSVSPREAAILTNGAAGVTLKAYPTTSGWTWTSAIDTAGYYGWTKLYNSDTTWVEGAFNMNATGHPNYGWGIYDAVTHNLSGVALYIIKTRDGSFKKIFIEKKLTVDQKYTFKYSDLDGTNEHIVNLDVSGKSKNFVFYSLETNETVDREPDISSWDIVFTKWMDKSLGFYPVTGVLQNIKVLALESTNIDPLSEDFPSTGYLTQMSVIGADWKSYNMETSKYVIDQTRVFFIKDQNGKVYRILFKTFEGSSTGNLSFDISTIK
jgi:hypothetical protein